MKRLMTLLGMLALVLAVSVPAMAQGAGQGFEEESESGDVSLSFSSENTGNNSSVCAPALQFGNSGNLQNEQGVLLDTSTIDEIEFEAEDQLVFEPSNETECTQAVQQSSAASSGGK